MQDNQRPCGSCRHLDSRQNERGAAYCWAHYRWQRPDDVVINCQTAERADGRAPPGRINYRGGGR